MTDKTRESYQNILKIKNQKIPTIFETIIVIGIMYFILFIISIAVSLVLSENLMRVVWPIVGACYIFFAFSYLLKMHVGVYLLGDIGFIYLSIAMLYTVLPGIKFLMLDLSFPPGFDGMNFSILRPTPVDLGVHFWRHNLFLLGVAIGYIAFRNKHNIPINASISIKAQAKDVYRERLIILALLAVIGVCLLIVTAMSKPVVTYYDHYTRFNHLAPIVRKMVNACLVIKTGSYYIVLVYLFRDYKRNKTLIVLFLIMICAYEMLYSRGSRIASFSLILATIGLYHHCVKHISIKRSIVLGLILAIFFTGIEGLRLSNGWGNSAAKTVKASEFEAVYATGFHLYHERSQDTLPPRPWQMRFYEVISIIPLIDHVTYNPQYWYAKIYFPEAAVPPTTMGVIASSALWGGEWELLTASLLNGMLFALVANWFWKKKEKWWVMTIYIFTYAGVIMTIKYSVAYQIIPFAQVMIPSLLVASIIRGLCKV